MLDGSPSASGGAASAPRQQLRCTVVDESTAQKKDIRCGPNTTQEEFCREVATAFDYKPDSFKVLYETKDGEEVAVDCDCTTPLVRVVTGDAYSQHNFLLRELDDGPPVPAGSNKRALVAVSPPSESKALRTLSDSEDENGDDEAGGREDRIRFVGLTNQGATCYLNSLLQTLYMTPEFRNAIYKWDPTDTEDLSIPAELQKLFLRLQTSKQRAVETKDITKSFGWEGNEAFQQHDVQELLRVLFDALEEEWQGTPLETTIKNLYEGEVRDYVSCTECGYESARTDKFMDVPLVIKPFGSQTVMKSVNEAMHKFVEVEKMEGDNQYHCERCDKKVDALKGLKFKKFPYLLTLQLKRFDFDYTTFRRIKLNSRFEFPTELDVSEFAAGDNKAAAQGKKAAQANGAAQAHGHGGGIDDGEATDNRSAADGHQGQQREETQRDCGQQEGRGEAAEVEAIDGGIGPEASDDAHTDGALDGHDNTSPRYTFEQLKREKQERRAKALEQGNLYELFSVMIHRGSALGGHYYAYIKSLEDGKWRCFNDSSVTVIKEDDIEDAFGGQQSMYGWSSTSGYMLMYRRIDPDRNASFFTVDDLPQRLRDLSEVIEKQETQEREEQLKAERSIRFSAFDDSGEKKAITIDRTLPVSALFDAVLKEFGVEEEERSKYRLCRYDLHRKRFLDAFQDMEKPLEKNGYTNNWTVFCVGLQKANSDGTFDEYDPDALILTLRHFDEEKKEFAAPIRLKMRLCSTLDDLRDAVMDHVQGGDPNKLTLIKSEFTTHVLRPGSLSKANFLAGGETIYSTFEDFSDDPREMTKSATGKELDRRKYEITVNVIVEDNLIAGGATHTLKVDKRMSLFDFKDKEVQPLLNGVSTDEFLLFRKRVYSGTEHLTELTRLRDTLDTNYVDTYPDVVVRRGKALKPGQVKTTLYLLDSEQQEAPELFDDFPTTSKGDVGSFINDIAGAVREKKESDPDWAFKDLPTDPQQYRLWDTTAYIRPFKVLRRNGTLPILYTGKSFLVQALDKPEAEISTDHKIVFARRFSPSTMELGDLEEMIVDREKGIPGLQEAVSTVSGIPVDDVVFAQTHIFPFKSDPFTLRDTLWSVPTGLYQLSCTTDGSGFFYKDKQEEAKELTEEEEEQLKRKQAQKKKAKSWYRKEVGIVIKRKNKRSASSSSKNDDDDGAENAGESKAVGTGATASARSSKDGSTSDAPKQSISEADDEQLPDVSGLHVGDAFEAESANSQTADTEKQQQ